MHSINNLVGKTIIRADHVYDDVFMHVILFETTDSIYSLYNTDLHRAGVFITRIKGGLSTLLGKVRKATAVVDGMSSTFTIITDETSRPVRITWMVLAEEGDTPAIELKKL